MLAQCLRLWANIEAALGECPVIAGNAASKQREQLPGGMDTARQSK